MCSLDFWHPKQQGLHKHKGIWWNVGESMVVNTSGAGRCIQIDYKHDTGQVQSESSRPPYQSTTEMIQTTPRRNRPMQSVCTTIKTKLDTSQIADINRKTGHPGVKKDSVFCQISGLFSINRSQSHWGMWTTNPLTTALLEKKKKKNCGEKKMEQVSQRT